VDPWGSVLAEAARGSAVVCEQLKRQCLDTIRRTFPSIYHRRLKCR